MKNKKSTKILIDFALVVGGIAISVVGLLMWKEIGFQLESKYYTGNNSGNDHFWMVLSGCVLAAYGILDFVIFRRSKNASNNESKSQL